MKKKLFTIAIALCMVFTMIPAGVFQIETAWADTSSSITIAGKTLSTSTGLCYHNDGTVDSIEETANAIFNPNTGEITLNGLEVTTDGKGIESPHFDNMTIILNGTNVIKTASMQNTAINGNASSSVTIKGSGSLELEGSYGIWVWNDITIEGNVKVDVTAKNIGLCNNSSSGNISIASTAEVTVDGGTYGIGADHELKNAPTISGANLVVKGGTAALQAFPTFDSNQYSVTGNTEKTESGASAVDLTASNVTNYKYLKFTQGHTHCICGSTHKDIGDHNAEVSTTFAKKIWMDGSTLKIDDKDWMPTSIDDNSSRYILEAGDYYLGSDIQLEKTIRIQEGTVNLCLNGKKITIDGDVEGITVGKNAEGSATFTLTDCKTGNAQGEFTHADAGEKSRGVYIYGKCQFNMYGGSITGHTVNTAIGGAGVGVAVGGKFNMYGGSISDNAAGNGAPYGGGVFVDGEFNMYGGSIDGNTSVKGGGGVFINVNHEGTVIGKFNISGDVNIMNNTTNDQPDNICLEKSDDGNTTASINIAGTLDAAARIGVTTAKKPTDTSLLIVTNADENTNYESIITSDDALYEITRDSNVKTNLVLKKIETPAQKYSVTITAGEGMTTTGNASQTDLTGAMTDVVYTAADGYYFPESYSVADTNGIKVTRNNETQITVSGTPTADTTIKLPAATKKVTIIFDANGGWFTSATHTKSTVKFKTGEIITVPTHAAIKSDKKYNYEFVGWYTEKEGGTLLDDNTKATADATYYAHWTKTPKVYTIKFVPDGGTINDTNYKTTYTWEDKIINLPTNVTKDGYEFMGWKRTAGMGSLCDSEWKVTENNLGDLTFYAWWVKKSTETTYEITFNANGGTVSQEKATTADDGTLASLPTPTRDGYIFNGWYTEATGGEKIEAGHKFTAKTTLYAQWTKKSSSSSSGGGSSTQKPTIIADEGANASLNYNGSRLTITANDGYEITDVLVNGVSKGAVAEITGLKTGDKVEVKTAKKAEPADPSKDNNAKLIKGVENTTIVLKSKLTKNGNVLLTWTKSKGYKVDKFEFYRSVKKNSGYGTKAFFTTKDGSWSKYLNTKDLKAGKTYYYKVRGVRVIDGKKYYTQWSNKAWRTIK